MARPIEPTPPVEGQDAERLLADLSRHCSSEEYARRVAAAEKICAEMTRDKGFPKKSPAQAERERRAIADGKLVSLDEFKRRRGL